MPNSETSPLLPPPGAAPRPPSPRAPAHPGRTLSPASAYMLILSRVVGSGIFAMPGAVLQTAGSPGLALLLWLLGAGVAWTGLAVALELGCALPRSGGVKVYLEAAYARPRFLASAMVAAQAVLLGFTASNCVVFAKYAAFAAGAPAAGDTATKLVAVGLLTAITLVHACARRAGIAVQDALGWLKAGLVAFMVVTGLSVLVLGPGRRGGGAGGAPPPFWEDLWGGSHWGWNGLATGLFKVFYSYAGLENVNNVLGEVRDPVRTLRRVAPAALITACGMYVLVNVAYLSVVPLEEVKHGRELIAALFFERLGLGRVFLSGAIALSAAGNVMVVTFSLARLNQEIARQGFLPFPELLASNRPFGSPMGGLIVHYIPSVLVIVIPPSADVYSFIADVEGYASQFFALAVAVGLIILRRRKPELHRPFVAWLPAVWLRILLSVGLIFAPLFPPRSGGADVGGFYAAYALVGIAVLAFGFLVWLVWTVLLPRLGGYVLAEEKDVLSDGTTITRLVKRRESKPGTDRVD